MTPLSGASTAVLDQVASAMREHAALAKIVYDAYVAAGFTEEQAFTLTRSKLIEVRDEARA